MSKIQDLSSKQQRIVANCRDSVAGAGLYSHATELQKQGIKLYKLAKKMCKRFTSAANTVYNYHMNHFVFSLVADYWALGSSLTSPATAMGRSTSSSVAARHCH